MVKSQILRRKCCPLLARASICCIPLVDPLAAMEKTKTYESVVLLPSASPTPSRGPRRLSIFGSFNPEQPETKEKHLHDIHWHSPAKMVFLLVFGISMSLGHHGYYQSKAGKMVGNDLAQQNAHRFVSNFY